MENAKSYDYGDGNDFYGFVADRDPDHHHYVNGNYPDVAALKDGVAIMNGTNIVGFIEKPTSKNPPSNLISAGLYMMSPELFAYIPKGYAKLETDVFPKLAREDLLVGYPFSGQYVNVQPGVAEKIGELWKGIIP